ncbi:MAG: serine/threonine-protein kinase [Cyanobacteria bacterium P01_D01_bin.1]
MKEWTAQKIRHYALQQELGHKLGHKADRKAGRRTFLARDLYTKTPVVVKILQFDQAFEWDVLKLFKREGQILQHLSHSTIPEYKDSFEMEINGVHSFVLVQAYIPAPSLQKVVEAGELFSESETIDIAQQLLKTLCYLHQQLPPVIHRDIKPSNILISDPSPRVSAKSSKTIQRNIYLVDFGAVQINASRNSGTVTIVGSYGYMPLEQFLGQTTPASDLYSLGMTLIYLLTGMHPSELPQLDGHVQIERIGEIAGLSDWFVRWLTRMIEPYLDQRFESSAVALATLNRKGDDACYFPHLRPKPHHLHISRNKDELMIVSGLPDRNRYWGCLVLPIIPLSLWVTGSLVGSFSALVISTVIILSLLFFALKVYRQAPNRYKVIYISRTFGIRAGTARGHRQSKLSSAKLARKHSLFDSIRLLTYSPGYTFTRYYDRKARTASPTSIRILPKLSIHTGNQEYSIQCKDLCEAEQHWLDTELNDFLGLSLQRLDPIDADTVSASRKTRLERQIEESEQRRKEDLLDSDSVSRM